MGLFGWRSHKSTGGPGAPSPENTVADEALEGHLEPNTAALMDGAPPAGASGRHQPSGSPPGYKQEPPGPSEDDTQHMPG